VIGLSFAAGIIAAASHSYWSDNRERLLSTNDDVANTVSQIAGALEEYSEKNRGAPPSSNELQTIVQAAAQKAHCDIGRSLKISSRLGAIDTRQGRHLLAWCTPREHEKWIAVSFSDSGKFYYGLLKGSEFAALAQADLGQ
jgi:hypothetical protein